MRHGLVVSKAWLMSNILVVLILRLGNIFLGYAFEFLYWRTIRLRISLESYNERHLTWALTS